MPKVWKNRVEAFFRWASGNANSGRGETPAKKLRADGPGHRCVGCGDRGCPRSRDQFSTAAKAIGWRIYRLPGSKEWWLIDHGPGSVVLFCKHWKTNVGRVLSVSEPTANPRAWIALEGVLYLDGDTAHFGE